MQVLAFYFRHGAEIETLVAEASQEVQAALESIETSTSLTAQEKVSMSLSPAPPCPPPPLPYTL